MLSLCFLGVLLCPRLLISVFTSDFAWHSWKIELKYALSTDMKHLHLNINRTKLNIFLLKFIPLKYASFNQLRKKPLDFTFSLSHFQVDTTCHFIWDALYHHYILELFNIVHILLHLVIVTVYCLSSHSLSYFTVKISSYEMHLPPCSTLCCYCC